MPDGTLVSLLGPSGGGKTTTLNLISGLLSPTAGQIFFW
ncbi:sugar ABC transporterATPase [Lacticaseibacillus paracasei subsp. paracasei Lpp126]|uniref:Sugar ABC transporterATPase n=1 Tax=Lacticaseibacillus paracasei subsp. paracasei Lpp126 TaxID=1256206 RepID=S2R7P2_LACPA|nr:sugar ABC transporterATPase [Lacticaseibacillus paracasei subsp. paracasei Lpp126]